MVSCISLLSDAVGHAIRRVTQVTQPMVRFWRLASLKSRIAGVVPASTQFDGPVRTSGCVRLHLGDHCRIGRDVFFETPCEGAITIGANTRINAGSVIVAYCDMQIGDNCLIGEYVSIRDANHGTSPGLPMKSQPHTVAPIRIGDDVWVGRGSVILKGVSIGDGAVIGANSVVVRDCPPREIHAGAPACRLKDRGS